MNNIEKNSEKERIELKRLESESMREIIQSANSEKSEEKLEKKDQFF